MASEETDYLLGTHDQEVARLGLQHRVWRPRVLDAWRRAGVTEGLRVIDAGAGPGWASLDLAEIVGAEGQVIALERSRRFLDHLNSASRQRGLSSVVRTHNLDLVTDTLPISNADGFWIRWVLAFVTDPAAVLAKLAAALKPGGIGVIHEYLDYRSWSMAPAAPAQEAFREFVISDWRASGGEPDIGRSLPALLPAAGLRIRELRPIVDVVGPTNYVWQWPASFLKSYPEHLIEAGKVDRAWADQIQSEFRALEANPASVMVTPMVLEVIVEKV